MAIVDSRRSWSFALWRPEPPPLPASWLRLASAPVRSLAVWAQSWGTRLPQPWRLGFSVPLIALDRNFPWRRVVQCIADVNAAALIVDSLEQCFGLEFRLAGLDVSDSVISFPAVAAAPDSTAYTILTSGSTGGPKAVSVNHRVSKIWSIGPSRPSDWGRRTGGP